MSIKDTQTSYGTASRMIHWIMALVIIGMYPLGLYIDSLSYYDEAYRTVPHWHKSIGMLLLGLLVLRIIWRKLNKGPAPVEQPRLLQLATSTAHSLLYLLMLAALISGYLISTADGRSIAVFNWFEIPALPALVENQEDIAGELHYWITTIMIGLAGVHAMAALKHHFINKDQTLTRMLGMPQETQQ